MRTGFSVLTVLLLLFVFASPALSDAAKNQQIDKRLEQVRQQNNLPQKASNGVVWENVSRQGDTIVYSYKVPSAKDSKWNKSKMRQQIIDMAKKDQQIRSDAMKLKFIYTFKGNKRVNIVVLPKDYL